MIVVPNSKMGEAILTNYMRPKPHFRIDLEFVLDYSVRPNRAIRVLTGAVKSLVDDIRILSDPGPEVRLDQAWQMGKDTRCDSLFCQPEFLLRNQGIWSIAG